MIEGPVSSVIGFVCRYRVFLKKENTQIINNTKNIDEIKQKHPLSMRILSVSVCTCTPVHTRGGEKVHLLYCSIIFNLITLR